MDWKNYEISSDSELEEEEIFKDPVKETGEKYKNESDEAADY